jgi:transketolase
MRAACVDMIFELARRDPRIVYIGSDLSPGIAARMKSEMPGRAFMEGVSEAHVVGMAAGLAMEGFVPFVHTIATFVTRRCYEQVAVDLCLHDLPVRLVGNGGGLVYAPLGPTHLAIEDIAIMRSLPNMAVVAVSDAVEMRQLMSCTLDWPHPIYIRLGKGGDKVIAREASGFRLGKAVVYRQSAASRIAVLVVSTGVMTARVLEAARLLEVNKIDAGVVHVHTIKPYDETTVAELARDVGLVVTVEEHVLTGGLGDATSDALSRRLGRWAPPVLRLGIPDAFAAHYGSQDDLLHSYGLQPESIAETIRAAVAA